MKNDELKTFELGIMSNKWEIQAPSADVAVVTIRLWIQTDAPVAIYSPESERSSFSFPYPSTTRKLEAFLGDKANQDAIKAAYKTIKTLPL